MSQLTKSVSSFTPNPIFMYNLNTVGYYDPAQVPFDNSRKYKYHDLITYCRHFYERDTIARTVINRMVNLAITRLRNRKTDQDATIVKFYDAVARKLQPFLKHMATEYFIHGMAVPGITYKQIMLNRLDPTLGRKRVEIPDSMWVRNPANIKLRKKPNGFERAVYIEIPPEEATFITSKGKRSDGTDDSAAFKELQRTSPAYVKAVLAGQRLFPIEEKPLFADIVSYNDYPLPFLQNALRAMQHKEYLKLMDQTIVSRSIELLRQIKVGSDQFPATQDDIEATQRAITDAAASGDRVFNLFTNHTVEISWVLPPLDALLNEGKYAEPNADIFLALGFPRILTVGESLRSNSSDSRIASLGPTATLTELRERILQWIQWLYEDLATRNGFADWPDPYFSPIQFQDMTALTQFAIQAQQIGSISKDTIAQLYGSTYEEEQAKIKFEVPDESNTDQPPVSEEPPAPTGSGV
jgi:hypothetical protein